MPDKSSTEASAWPVGLRLAMLVSNTFPLLHGLLCAWLWWCGGIWSALAGLYLLPPLLARLWLAVRSRPEGQFSPEDSGFMTWWITLQAQMIFNRIPWLEELLRLVPGLYSLWMRLWGASVGRLTFWGPGARIVDRPFVEIGNDVILGGGCQIGSHLLVKTADASMSLTVAKVRIGDAAMVGTYALIGPGVEIEPKAEVRACAIVPPFNHWRGDKRVKPESHE